MLRLIVITLDGHDIGHHGGNFEAVLVFNKDDVLTLEACHAASSCRTQKPDFISYFQHNN